MLDPLLLAIGLAQSEDLTLSIGALDDTNTNAGMFLDTTYAHRVAD